MTATVPCSCVRPDETSATVRCHYLRDGTAKFAFTVGRAEFFIPVGILLKCFVEASDKELFTKLLATIPQDQGEPRKLTPPAYNRTMWVPHKQTGSGDSSTVAVTCILLTQQGHSCTRMLRRRCIARCRRGRQRSGGNC